MRDPIRAGIKDFLCSFAHSSNWILKKEKLISRELFLLILKQQLLSRFYLNIMWKNVLKPCKCWSKTKIQSTVWARNFFCGKPLHIYSIFFCNNLKNESYQLHMLGHCPQWKMSLTPFWTDWGAMMGCSGELNPMAWEREKDASLSIQHIKKW